MLPHYTHCTSALNAFSSHLTKSSDGRQCGNEIAQQVTQLGRMRCQIKWVKKWRPARPPPGSVRAATGIGRTAAGGMFVDFNKEKWGLNGGSKISLRLGHVRVLTCHRHVIHYPHAASLPRPTAPPRIYRPWVSFTNRPHETPSVRACIARPHEMNRTFYTSA